MGITASSPDAFFDGEDFTWQSTFTQEDGVTPLNLTGSRLFARFEDLFGILVGVCDSDADDKSLQILDAENGIVQFLIPAANRAWKPQTIGPLHFRVTGNVYGDLYRYAEGMNSPQGVCCIEFAVLSGTGAST